MKRNRQISRSPFPASEEALRRRNEELELRVRQVERANEALRRQAAARSRAETGVRRRQVRQTEAALQAAVQSLAAERDVLQAVMENARKSNLAYLDREFNFVRVNTAYAQNCGYRPEEMVGKNHFALYPHPENEAIFAQVRDTGIAVEYHDKPFVYPDQPERGVTYWDWTLAPVKSRGGKVVGLVLWLVETTERKKADEELQAAKRMAEEANRAKSEFLANMSHEFRTPMTVFIAATEHLLVLDDDPARRNLLEMAAQSAERLRALIDDLLDFSRIEAHRLEIESAPFDPRSCLQSVVTMFTLPAGKKNLRLETTIAPETPATVEGDAGRVGQVLINLIGNAIKFTDGGEVRVSLRPRGAFLEFAIADTGIGIPDSKQHLLFRSFSQVDSSFTRRFGGTGLGLAISKGLVELMGGEISVRSREGHGSTFTFTIPFHPVGTDFSPAVV